MKRWTALILAVLFLAACDKSETNETTEGAPTAEGVEEQTEAAMEEVAEAAKYDKEMRKKACELLTPEMVSEAFGVPAGELEQLKAMGCIYNWEKGDQMLQVRFGSIRIHKNNGVAKKWFENATKGMTADETREAMAEITKKAKEDERIDTETKKKATDKVGGIMGEMGGFSFEDFDGVADEARIGLSDGEVWARKGNMTFIVTAYKGPKQPDPKAKMDGDMKAYMREVQKENREWVTKTMDARREGARKIGKMVVDKL